MPFFLVLFYLIHNLILSADNVFSDMRPVGFSYIEANSICNLPVQYNILLYFLRRTSQIYNKNSLKV